MFRDAHYYGCISLTQSVAEALVRFICEKNCCTVAKDFTTNVNRLCGRDREFISTDVKGHLLQIWDQRNNFHHLNPSVEQDLETLENLAREKVSLLQQVESEVFQYTVADGKLVPKYPRYWDINGDQAEVFLRFE